MGVSGLLLLLAALGQAPVADMLAPAAAGSVRLTGRLGARLDACIDQGLLAQAIEPLVKPYRDKREVGDGDWRCEYWGKWVTGLTLADGCRDAAATHAKRDEAARALIATAAPDGYLGTRQVASRLKGWDVWGRKYALLGLVACYDRSGDAAVLQAACRAADTLLAEIGQGRANIADLGYAQWKGLPASSVLEPIVLLYQRTREPRYLAFARAILDAWTQPSKLAPKGMRLIEDALAGVAPSKMVSSKAYEQMSCFEGLCELYRALTFCDHLSAGTLWSSENRFRTWLPQPLDLGTVYETGQTWQSLSHQRNRRPTVPGAAPTGPAALAVANPETDLALARHGAVATASSVYDREPDGVARVNDGLLTGAADFDGQRWHSSLAVPHPHWVCVKLARPARLSRAVIHPADPGGYPVRFRGEVQRPGETAWTTVFRCERNPGPAPYEARFEPVEAAAFRLVIEASANPQWPNAAQVSEIELRP